MDLATIDATLARLRATVAVMSTNLVDLENDPGRTRLEHATLTGTTAIRWAEARRDLACLWQWFTLLEEALDKATQLRGTRSRLDGDQLAQLDALINASSIELVRADVPLAQRGLFGPTQTSVRCSPPELLDRMRIAFDPAVAVIGACAQKWSALESALVPLDAQLADARHLADDLNEHHHPELDQVQAQLAELHRTVSSDPLAASDEPLKAMSDTLGSVVDDLRRLAQLKDGLTARLTEARSLMVDLRATTAAAAAARAEALAKIAHATVVDSPCPAGHLEQELAQVEAAAAGGDWRRAADALVQWTTRCRHAGAEAERALAANRAPLATRNELRGRLDAYRAKAYRLGRLEDPAVAALHARAQAALFTAPTDLDQAEQLVRSYQQALTAAAPRQVAP